METGPTEEYLESIYGIVEEGRKARTTELAKRLKVKPASVTGMLKRLSKEGYITYRPYEGAHLTQKGLKVGQRIKRKHRILERFLFDILGISRGRVHDEACRMEHALSDESEKAMDELMGYPSNCPDDKRPIPRRVVMRGMKGDRLICLAKGVKARVLGFIGGKCFKTSLRTVGIREGKNIEVVSLQPLGGPLVVKVDNTTLAVGRGMASKVIVKRLE
jgi:DtxR family Mn-dependent transcriptional regulator